MHRYLTNIWSFVRPLIPKSIPLGSNLQAFPYFFLSVKISIRKNFSFPFTIFLLFSSHPFRVVSYFSGLEQISDLQIFQVFILSVLNLVPLLFPEIFLWPDPKSSFKIFRFEKFFSNCQRLCSFWMRFEGFRASDKISVQQLVTFHCVSRFIPALEINRLWKEFLFLDRKQFRIFSYRLGGGISSREILVPKEPWFRFRFGTVHRSNWCPFVQRNFLLEIFLWSGSKNLAFLE